MKTILGDGDSNSRGFAPGTRPRFGPDERRTGVPANRLGAGYRVIEEGLNGRTTRWDDPIEPGRDGLAYLRPRVESDLPLDPVTVTLGTNDLARRFELSASEIARSAVDLAATAQRFARTAEGTPATVPLIAPPPVARLSDFDEMFAGAAEKARRFARSYRMMAGFQGLPFFDAGSVVASSDLDGIHLDADEHRKPGEAIAPARCAG